MSTRSKKQRAKARKAEVRTQSGIVLRAVKPPAEVVELRPKARTPASPSAPSAPSDLGAEPPKHVAPSNDAPAAEGVRRDAIPPGATSEGEAVPAESLGERPRSKPDGEVPRVVETPGPGEDGASAEATSAPAVPTAAPVAPSAGPAASLPEEQRASPRVALEVDIHLASDSHFFSGLSGDISEGGLFLSTYRPLPVGTQVDVEFSLPGMERAIHAHGEVRWIREHTAEQTRGVGIAFEGLPDEDRDVIHAFCSARPPLYYEDVG